jgi:hypothetical protein
MSTRGGLNSALFWHRAHPKHVLCSSRDSLHDPAELRPPQLGGTCFTLRE